MALDIQDDGPGLPPEIAQKIGTPFFTTKEDRGMGLGVYLARTVLGRFEGSGTLENRPEGGTHTRIRLPLTGLLLRNPHD